MKLPLTVVAFAATLVALVLPLRAEPKYPEPSPYPIAWEFTFDYDLPARIVVNAPNSTATKAYWYLPYTITNEGEDTQTFIPQLLTDDGKLHKANRDVPKYVFDAIRTRQRNDLLLPPTRAGGELRPGVDQARDSIAVWEEPNPDMDTFRIFVGGLSGEFVELKDDKGVQLKDKKGEPIILRKTLQLTFHTKGDDVHPGDPDPLNEGEGRIGKNKKVWVMR
jgi:hypothetical protein